MKLERWKPCELTEDEVMERATTAYYRRAKRVCNNDPPIPSMGRSDIVDNLITLENVNGVLARYRWTGKRLVKLRPENDDVHDM